jgi:hypothetical protein
MNQSGSKRPREDFINLGEILREDEVTNLKEQLEIAKMEIEDFKEDLGNSGIIFCNYCSHNTHHIPIPECVVCGEFLPCKKWCLDILKREIWYVTLSDGQYVCSEECMAKEERIQSSVKYNKKCGF